MYVVDIDTGGTMTDTLVSGSGAPLLIKVESTPHDVTVSFMQSVESAAQQLGFGSLRAFLKEVRLIRWSSTLTSNVLAQRSGPKLGLIVSAGHERDLYSEDPAQVAHVMPSLIRPEHIASLPQSATRADIVAILKRLIDQGIRRISVSLKGAFPDGSREQEVLRVIEEQFPDHFLGSVPALAGSEMLMRPDDMSRTFFALINAYVHNALASSLFKAEDAVKVEHDWRGHLLIGHLNGGVARVGKTKAVDTIESGPLFGTHASAHVARMRSLQRVLAIDIGGTTGKCSAISHGAIAMHQSGDLFGIPVRLPMPVLRSTALGGGSVATVAGGVVSLGPESMGAVPGPACYGLGGTRATLTDALVLLGTISPSAFLDGRRVLDVERARVALSKHVAEPLGIDVVAAAIRVYDGAVRKMAQLLTEVMREVKWRDAKHAVLFAYGGNGPLFATSIAEVLGLREVHLFALGTIFSAYGSAIADVLHVYERGLIHGTQDLQSAGMLLHEHAQRDLKGEGFDPSAADFLWRLDNSAEGTQEARGTVGDMVKAFGNVVANAQVLRLEARIPLGGLIIPEREQAKAPMSIGKRSSGMAAGGELPVYTHEQTIGQTIEGPCVIDGGTFTWLVGTAWTARVDRCGDAILRRSG